MLFECPIEKSYSILSITNYKGKALWEDPSNSATRPKTWKTDDGKRVVLRREFLRC
jgi:hypothetical protein